MGLNVIGSDIEGNNRWINSTGTEYDATPYMVRGYVYRIEVFHFLNAKMIFS
jgi:hypothetical protein